MFVYLCSTLLPERLPSELSGLHFDTVKVGVSQHRRSSHRVCGIKRGARGSHPVSCAHFRSLLGECEGCYFLRSDCQCPMGGSAS